MSKVNKPVAGQKIWIRRKGCKNAAKMWVVDGIDKDGEEYGRWFVTPMNPGKEFVYQTIPFKPGSEFQYMKNIYQDLKTSQWKVHSLSPEREA